MKSWQFMLGLGALSSALQGAQLLPSNREAPFCYEAGGLRRWPVLTAALPGDAHVQLKISGKTGDRRLEFGGLVVVVTEDGWLEIQSPAHAERPAFEMEITLSGNGVSQTQAVKVRAAPPPRPVSYIADFGDDLIDLFFDRGTGRWKPLEKGAFDQYFRRLQAHGVARLIIWQSPFPYMADARNYAPEDWERYVGQARAIIDDAELSASMERPGGPVSWNWLRQLMRLRLTPEFGSLLTQSAADHGIRLTASFRPFEMALEKYYMVPAFEEDGVFLWNFRPLSSPAVSHHAQAVGFAHYRKVLEGMGRADEGRLQAVELKGVADLTGLRLFAAQYPPLQEDSLVLVRAKTGAFQLRRFREIRRQAEAHWRELNGLRVESTGPDSWRISGIAVPDDCRFVMVSTAAALTAGAAKLFAKAGNELGRVNVYLAAAAEDVANARTRVAGITPGGGFWSLFQAVETSLKTPPIRGQWVIDLGDSWSVEMVDFNQPLARAYAIREMRTMLKAPFDEIFINTRSHTSLAATMADGADGLQPIPHYAAAKQPYVHLGLDRAFAPRSAAEDARLRGLAADKITCWQPGEWDGTCQSADSRYPWRYARNRGVADGVRKLLQDLEATFPNTRIRAVIPEGAQAVHNVKTALDAMTKPDGSVYGRDYYRHIWASINHIPAIGEGMSLVDLQGLRVEPVFGGIRFLPDRGPFQLFVREVIADLRGNRGSSFRGPRSFFYEGHETLRMPDAKAGRQGREERIRHLLDQHGEINEVILYESAAWLGLPLDDPDLCGHGFLDHPAATAPAK